MMKVIKYFALAVVAVPLFTSCSDDENDIFEESPAIRLDNYNKQYAAALTADGGKWAMEYFTNEEEPGYVFVMTFGAGGGVTVTGLNKYVDLKFGTTDQAQSDTSVWEMISDNGPVLSFNSYNEVFHIFSDPGDIEDGKTNPDTGADIKETGYGHSGDYEFMFMEVSEDNNTVRLLGKKRGYNIYMHRLPADTDDAAYLQNVKAQNDKYFSLVPQTILTDGETGEQFVMYDMASGYCSAYPKAGDDITQTSKANFIVTERGIRFREPFSIERADVNADPMVIEEFLIQEDGSLKSENGSVIRSDSFENAFMNSGRNWRWDKTATTGVFAKHFTDMNRAIGTANRGQTLQYVQMSYDKSKAVMNVLLKTPRINANILLNVEQQADGKVKLSFSDKTNGNGLAMYNSTAEVKAFFNYLCSEPLVCGFDNAMAITSMTLALSSTPNETLHLNIQ